MARLLSLTPTLSCTTPAQTHHGFGACFVLGVLCNWLVCIATWQANAAQDMTGKFIAIW
jgi:formate/nitrite transporter FocA (FNT family)